MAGHCGPRKKTRDTEYQMQSQAHRAGDMRRQTRLVSIGSENQEGVQSIIHKMAQ